MHIHKTLQQAPALSIASPVYQSSVPIGRSYSFGLFWGRLTSSGIPAVVCLSFPLVCAYLPMPDVSIESAHLCVILRIQLVSMTFLAL